MNISTAATRPRRSLAALVGFTALALLAASPAGATAGPGAYGERVTATVTTGLLPPAPVNSGPLPEVHAPPAGTATASVLTAAAPPLLTTGLLVVSSNQGFSSASVDNANALNGVLTATAIRAECTGPLGKTELVGARINGGALLAVNPAPNTSLLNAGGISIVANRQFTAGGDFVVRAIEITLTNAPIGTGTVNGQIVISEARCNTAAPIPAGAIGALGLAALVGVLFAGQQVVSRRRRHSMAAPVGA